MVGAERLARDHEGSQGAGPLILGVRRREFEIDGHGESRSMGGHIDEFEAFDGEQKDRRPRFSRGGVLAALEFATWLAMVLVLNRIIHHSGRVAASLGCHPDVVVGAIWIPMIVLAFLRIRREPPPQGPPPLDRWLILVMLAAGFGVFCCHTGPGRHDRWFMSGPITLSGLLIAGTVCFLRWIDRNYPGGLAEIWRRASCVEPGGKPKEKIGVNDPGLD